MPGFNFLIGVAGTSSRWRHTVYAPTLTHATYEVSKIANIMDWQLIIESEYDFVLVKEHRRE